MAVDFRILRPVEFYKQLIEQGLRPDGRELKQSRSSIINVGSITTAEGSSLIKCGNTTVICGIKGEIATPKSEDPGKGFIVPNVDLPPLCSPDFKYGPPSDQAQVATVFLDNVISNSHLIDLEELCIENGKAVWVLYCDIICLSYDGSLLDVCCLALLAALKNTRLPTVIVKNEVSSIPTVDLKQTKALSVKTHPLATSFAFYNEDLALIDPTQEEEKQCQGTITIVTVEDGSVVLLHKPGGCMVKDKQLTNCISRALTHNNELRQQVLGSLNTADKTKD